MPFESIDLFYPSAEAKQYAAARRKQIAESGTRFREDLRLEDVKRLVSLNCSDRFSALADELSDDIPTLEYRLDCLEDFLRIPELSETLRRAVSELSRSRPAEENAPRVNSFYELNEKTDALTEFMGAISEINGIFRRISGGIRSEAVKRLAAFFEELPKSESCAEIARDLAELREITSKSVKSVRVGINFDGRMIPESAGIIEVSRQKIRPRANVIERLSGGSGERFSGEEHLNSAAKGLPPDIDTALFRELSELTAECAKRIASALKAGHSGLLSGITELERQLDYYADAAAFVKSVEARGLKMCRPRLLTKEKREAKISGIFDLCLYREFVAKDALGQLAGKIITNDVEFNDGARIYTVTGANNGGKTTFARAVGLCQLLAQTGMYVPAEEAEISVCDNIFTHFPRDEKTGIDASRFTTEIRDLREIVRRVTPHSLVILNESLQSTTPEECLDIAQIHLGFFAEAGARGIYVTHLTGIYKRFDELNAKGGGLTAFGSLVSAADAESGRRLYKMLRQPPSGESLAFTIFRQFGAREEDLIRK